MGGYVRVPFWIGLGTCIFVRPVANVCNVALLGESQTRCVKVDSKEVM